MTGNKITPALTYSILGDREYLTFQFTCKWGDAYLELAEPAPELTAKLTAELGLGGGEGWCVEERRGVQLVLEEANTNNISSN